MLAFSLLNPHVYLDTVVLLGSIGGQQEEMDGCILPWAQCWHRPYGLAVWAWARVI
jgi:arginine exporter protein ArgO